MSTIKPTSSIIKSCQYLLLCKAWTETVRPIVTSYKTKILREMKPIAKRLGKSSIAGEIISDPEVSYRLSDSDAVTYYQRCAEEADLAGLYVENPEFCPLLVALHDERLAENDFLRAMQPVTDINPLQGLSSENRRKLLDLSIRYVVTYCGDNDITLIKESCHYDGA